MFEDKPKDGSIIGDFANKVFDVLLNTISTEEDKKRITKAFEGFGNFKEAFYSLEKGASSLNAELLLSRNRISEFKVTIADTLPLVAKLGGDYTETMKVIKGSIDAMGRNVIFEPEIYEKLFAAQTLIGKEASTMITNFGEAGIMASKIGNNLEKSLDYIRTVGVNAKSVMGNVVDNTEMLNRFSFQEGVLGFTKMAAQASILKVNMTTISNIADKVFEPEGAIDMAAAFQRLGVFVGDLADPFMLMNKSLNDPEGLIMSVAKAGEKFTQFNEEAGRFEINPSAMNQMSKMADAVGMNAAEFKKMSLNLAEFNARASEIDIKFNLTDEQKMFVANLAYLDTDNEYKIKVTDEKTGESIATAVKDLTEKQISQLNELSKQEPKTLEELTRDSMDIVATIASDVGAIKYKLLFGAVSEQSIMGRVQEGIRTGAGDVGDIIYKGVPRGETARETIRGVVNPVANMYKGEDFGANMEKIMQAVGKYLIDIPKNISQGIKDSKELGTMFGTGYGLEALLDNSNKMFGDITGNMEKIFNIQSAAKIEGGEQMKNLEKDIKGVQDSLNNPKDLNNKLTINLNVKQTNNAGAVISKSSVDKAFDWVKSQDLVADLSSFINTFN
jgi:hypothetical protein